MASKFLTPLDLSNFTNTPLANTSVGFVKVYIKNNYLRYLLPSGVENDVVLSRPLDGLSIPTLATGIVSSDSLLIALSKLQASLNNIVLTGDVTGTASYISGLLTINATLTTSGLTPTNIANWNTAYGWGDHAAAGYLTTSLAATTYVSLSGSYSNPTWLTTLAWSKITGAPAFLTTETDPIFTASPAFGITSTNISNWDTAYGWGDHASAGYVPYIGATTNVNLGNHGLISDYLQLNNLPLSVPTTAGAMAWNDVDGTLDVRLKGGNVTLQVGQETIIRVVNKTDINLLEANYQVVRVRTQAEGGAQGQRLAVKLAQANSKANHTGILGLVTETINNNQEGFITTFGLVRNINTTGNLQGETWSDGTVLWLSETVPGGLTSIEPLSHPVQMGYVVYAHQNNGKIFVSIEEGVDELGELHNVSAQSPSNGDILQYVSSTGLWTKVAGVTTNIGEGTNLYFTDARSRAAISLTTSGTSGSATYDNLTGVLNIPSYASGLTIGSTAIASGTVGRILYEGAGNVLQQSANLVWDNASNLLKIANAKLEGGQFYSSHQPKLNLSANSGFSAIQYEFPSGNFLVGNVTVYGTNDIFFQGLPSSTSGFVALEAWNSAGLILATGNNTNPIQFRINRGLRATLNNVGFGYGVVPTAPIHAKGNSDSVGNVFIVESLSQNRLIIGNNGNHAINTTIDANFNLKIVGENGILYQNTAGTRFIRFRLSDSADQPLDLRLNNGQGNSVQMTIKDRDGSINFKTSFASGAGYYLALGSNVSSSPFAYTAPGLRIYGATLVQGLNNNANFGWNRFAAVGISAHGDFSTGSEKQSAFSIQSFHTNTDISKQVSMLRIHADTTFSLSAGNANGIIRGLDINHTINQTGGSTQFIGIDYQPIITSILGAHYGFLIRPTTLNGIGLGATLPAAALHINSPNTIKPLKVDVGTVDSALLVESTGEVTTRIFKWTIDLMSFTTIDIVADTNFKIVSVTNIKNSPTTTLQVNSSPYTLGTNITSGDTINVQVSTLSVIKLNCELI
jgi:hypothetical protein